MQKSPGRFRERGDPPSAATRHFVPGAFSATVSHPVCLAGAATPSAVALAVVEPLLRIVLGEKTNGW